MNRRQFCRLGAFLAFPPLLLQTACTPQAEKRGALIHYPEAGKKFPVVINHALGSIRLERAPERVAVIGVETEDIVFGLGVLPVMVEKNFWGGDEQGYLPWFKEALSAAGKPLPGLVNSYPEIDIETLVGIKPDLILAQQSGITPAVYRQLSAVAPVLAYPDKPWLTGVPQLIDTTAAALGKPAEAEKLHAQLNGIYAGYRRRYPQLAHYTFAYFYAAERMSHLSIYPANDPRVATLNGLGLRLAPFMEKLSIREGGFTANIGLENADMLNDTDIVFTWFGSEEDRRALENNPLFASIPAVKRGSYIALTDKALSTAMYYGTPLSLKWALPKFMPELMKAVRRLEAHRRGSR